MLLSIREISIEQIKASNCVGLSNDFTLDINTANIILKTYWFFSVYSVLFIFNCFIAFLIPYLINSYLFKDGLSNTFWFCYLCCILNSREAILFPFLAVYLWTCVCSHICVNQTVGLLACLVSHRELLWLIISNEPAAVEWPTHNLSPERQMHIWSSHSLPLCLSGCVCEKEDPLSSVKRLYLFVLFLISR